MRFWKRARTGEPVRRRDEMRERVARAVQAARAAQGDVPGVRGDVDSVGGINGSRDDNGNESESAIARRMEIVAFTAVAGPARKVQRRAARGLAPELVRATARAAREIGRQPEEIWAEALREWLAARAAAVGSDGVPRPVETRRARCWREIETTLRALRAS